MKLLGLRAAGFRRFAHGIAVEGFAPGVNLLAGPNELGKSTLFQALEAAFLLKFGTSGAAVEALRPRGGGDPLVEADFDAAGRRWRIRKQFGRGKAAILTDLESGRAVARAGEAEEQLAALIGARNDGPGRMGLVWVRQQRALQPPDPDIEHSSTKRARSESSALMELLNTEVVEAAGSGLAERIAKRARADLETYVTQQRTGAKKHGPYDKALTARDGARAALEAARDNARASEELVQRIATGTRMLAEAEEPAILASMREQITMLEKALVEAGVQRERGKALGDQARARELESREARRIANEAKNESVRAGELRSALEQAKKLHALAEELSERIKANAATPPRLAALETAIELCKREERAIEEMSTFVEVTPEPGARQRIAAEGSPIEAHTRIAVPEQLTLTIAGAGTIRVTSSDAKRAAAAKARIGEQQNAIARLLAETGAVSIEGAREGAQARVAASAAFEEVRQQLTALAPRGLVALEAEATAVAAKLSALDGAGLETAAANAEVQALAARRAFNEAHEGTPDEQRYGKIAAELNDARAMLQKRQDDARRFSELLHKLKGEQVAASDGSLTIGAAQAALERAEQDVRRCEQEIAALRLLLDTLTGVIEGVRSRYLEPVTQAFLPYLTRVFPGAAADFREGFSLQALVRAGQQEDFTTLSDGTREQLSVLVRLGFAALFAERGAPVPLVLDDPLVYSDDARLAAMCEVLNEAGAKHQVFVLTCRQSAFTQLAAHRLAISPWDGGGAA